LEFKTAMESQQQEIARLEAIVTAGESEIQAIRQSWTWKTGRILLYPLVLVARKLKLRKQHS
jgi:hypothetical protein